MKKVIIFIDVIIILLCIYQYVLFFYHDTYRENVRNRILDAIESKDMQSVEKQFAKDCQIYLITDEAETRYRVGYIINQFEEKLLGQIESVDYLEEESAYKIVYYDKENDLQEKIVYINYNVEQVTYFQLKISRVWIEY